MFSLLLVQFALFWGSARGIADITGGAQRRELRGVVSECAKNWRKNWRNRLPGGRHVDQCNREREEQLSDSSWEKCWDWSDETRQEKTENSQAFLDANTAAEERALLAKCCSDPGTLDGQCEECPGDPEFWSLTCRDIACMNRADQRVDAWGKDQCEQDVVSMSANGQNDYPTFTAKHSYCRDLECPCTSQCEQFQYPACYACAVRFEGEGKCECRGDMDGAGSGDGSSNWSGLKTGPFVSICEEGEVCCNGICQQNVWPEKDGSDFADIKECVDRADNACREQVKVWYPTWSHDRKNCGTAIAEAGGRRGFVEKYWNADYGLQGVFEAAIAYSDGKTTGMGTVGSAVKGICTGLEKSSSRQYNMLLDFNVPWSRPGAGGAIAGPGGWEARRILNDFNVLHDGDNKVEFRSCNVWLYEFENPEAFAEARKCAKDFCCLDFMSSEQKLENTCNGCDRVRVESEISCPTGQKYNDRKSGWMNCKESEDNWCKGMPDSNIWTFKIGRDWDRSVLLDLVLVFGLQQWHETANIFLKTFGSPVNYWECCYNLNKCYGKCVRPGDCNNDFRMCWYETCMNQWSEVDDMLSVALLTIQSVVTDLEDAKWVADFIGAATATLKCLKRGSGSGCNKAVEEWREFVGVDMGKIGFVTKGDGHLGAGASKVSGKFKAYCLKPAIDAIINFLEDRIDNYEEGADTCKRKADSAHSHIVAHMYNEWSKDGRCNNCHLQESLKNQIARCYNLFPEPVTGDYVYFCDEADILFTMYAEYGCMKGGEDWGCVEDIADTMAATLLQSDHGNLQLDKWTDRRLSNFEKTVLGAMQSTTYPVPVQASGNMLDYQGDWNSFVVPVQQKCFTAWSDISNRANRKLYRHSWKGREYKNKQYSNGFMTNKCCSHLYDVTMCIAAAFTGAPQFTTRPWGEDFGGRSSPL